MTTTTKTKHICACDGRFQVVDEHGSSMTVRCVDCLMYSLVLDRFRKPCIRLANFHHFRGDPPDKRPLNDLTMANELVDCLIEDVWPSLAIIADFGIASSSHLGALQYAMRDGASAYDLDRVMADGPAITELVRGVQLQPYAFVEFVTLWDAIRFPLPDEVER